MRKWTLLMGAGVGAGLMYLFDPDRGVSRRARLRDRYERAARQAAQTHGSTRKDLRQRAKGWAAFARAWWSSGMPVSDDVVHARVRAVIGHVAMRPSNIDVTVRDGYVTLRGSVPADELPLVMDRVYGVRGVVAVENRLESQPVAEQGSGGRRYAAHRQYWSSSARLGAGLGGGALALYGLARGGFVARAVGLAGVGLLTRAATNLDWRRLTGIGAGRRGVDIQKTVRIQAPIERVFDVWSHCENFPNFMTHVRHVQELPNGQTAQRWRWTVSGPAGTEFDFDTAMTAYEPNRVIGWRTEPGSLIQHAGHVRFTEEPGGATRADVRLTYNPVAGAVGHAVARLFGADAKTQMDDDLMRMKNYIETGVPPHDAAAASPRPSV